MDETEYTRVANRGIAAAHLETLTQTLESFRMAAELAGIHVNERVVVMKHTLTDIGAEIYQESWRDRNALIPPALLGIPVVADDTVPVGKLVIEQDCACSKCSERVRSDKDEWTFPYCTRCFFNPDHACD